MIRVPPFSEVPGLSRWLADIFVSRDRTAATDYLKKNQANYSVLLLSPGGKTYEVTVDDTGVLTTTLVQG
jgi:hypothetical protein